MAFHFGFAECGYSKLRFALKYLYFFLNLIAVSYLSIKRRWREGCIGFWSMGTASWAKKQKTSVKWSAFWFVLGEWERTKFHFPLCFRKLLQLFFSIRWNKVGNGSKIDFLSFFLCRSQQTAKFEIDVKEKSFR